MGDVKWPAVAMQSIFLASNIAFYLDGRTDNYFLISFTLIMFLFTIQILSKNPRFMYLFPIEGQTGRPYVGLDTWILRTLLIFSILFFYIGATKQVILPSVIVVIGLIFPFIWDRYIESLNQSFMKRSHF